ncbi:MAG: RecQ family ATP-dependent DNA helicase [Myxococcales bacterium]
MEERLDLAPALRTHLGHESFRPGQEEIVRSVLSGRPTVAVMPTGSGKSLCYQLPAVLLPGTTVVASPLVALMKDQADALASRGIAATFVNSSLPDSERHDRQERIRRGEFKLVYVAPERFRSASFRSAVAGLNVPLFAVDEAHCISAWGHDFRPDYLRLAEARGHLRAERVLALTATATPEVRSDIVRALALEDPRVFVSGFDRPNLFLEVARVPGDEEKLGRILALSRKEGPGLVYAATRKNVTKVVAALRRNGVLALGYHAGMDDAERSAVQDRFHGGDAPVIVATNAFGMGVDRSDVRFVAHFDVPRSLEAWYQEIGRAGRDGKPSLALLLFNFADVAMQRRMIDASHPREPLLRRLWDEAREMGEGPIDSLAERAGARPQDAQAALKLFARSGHVARSRGREAQSFAVRATDASFDDLGIDLEAAAARLLHERRMLDRMVRFVDEKSCRRRAVLRYFGDPSAPLSCAACDLCAGAQAPQAEALSVAKAESIVAAAAALSEGEFDPEAFEALRSLRTRIAREDRVPPYVVFHDATLRALAQALPTDESTFLAVKGAGPGRWQKYGEKVISALASFAARKAAEGRASA